MKWESGHSVSKKYEFGGEVLFSPMEFFQFGMLREVQPWVGPVLGLPLLHLGPGAKVVEGATDIEWPEYDLESSALPYEDDSVGAVFATHVLEHLNNPLHIVEEAARVLVPGAAMTILVPHGQSLCFLQDLDHKTAFVLETWKTALDTSYYSKSKGSLSSMRLGFNMMMAVKEANTALVTQLIKN